MTDARVVAKAEALVLKRALAATLLIYAASFATGWLFGVGPMSPAQAAGLLAALFAGANAVFLYIKWRHPAKYAMARAMLRDDPDPDELFDAMLGDQ